jgi:hypothetical protein
MKTLSSRPFYPSNSRWVSLLELSAKERYTTRQVLMAHQERPMYAFHW